MASVTSLEINPDGSRTRTSKNENLFSAYSVRYTSPSGNISYSENYKVRIDAFETLSIKEREMLGITINIVLRTTTSVEIITTIETVV